MERIKLEIEGDLAIVHLPENVKIARIFTLNQRVELTGVGEDIKAIIVDRPQQK